MNTAVQRAVYELRNHGFVCEETRAKLSYQEYIFALERANDHEAHEE